MNVELLYFANPMCSWCWGFAPAMRAVCERWPGLRVTVALGSLGADRASRPMDARDRAFVRSHWERVREVSGQPFDLAFFERERFVYDTAPASRALALIRSRYPDLALAALHRIQELFYARNVDVTDPARLREIAGEFGVDNETFDALFDSPALRAAVAHEWEEVARLGVTGYPTLLALVDGRARVASLGWRPVGELLAGLEQLGLPA